MCVSQVPAAPCWPAGSWTFHSTTIAPAAAKDTHSWLRSHEVSDRLGSELGGRTRTTGREDHVRDLEDARRAGGARTDDGTGCAEDPEVMRVSITALEIRCGTQIHARLL